MAIELPAIPEPKRTPGFTNGYDWWTGNDYREGMGYVYLLLDPRDFKVRYVGGAKNPRYRYCKHTWVPSQWASKKTSASKAITAWADELRRQHLEVVLLVIEEVSYKKLRARELYWIRRYDAEGHPLLNVWR